MTEAKWKQVCRESINSLSEVIHGIPNKPEYWSQVKEAYMGYLGEIDKHTEVYNMENTKK